MSRGRRAVVAGVAILGLLVAAAAVLLVAGPTTRAISDGGVAVECRWAADTEATCAAWADAVLASGPGTRTFDVEDVSRLRLERGVAGLGSTCEAAYFLGRYEDRPVLVEEVTCPAESGAT